MTVLAIGNPQGVVSPGVPGATDAFPGQDFTTLAIRRLTENRMAGLSNKTLDFKPSWNDVLYSQRSVYDNAFPKAPQLFDALSAARLLGNLADVPTQLAQGTAFTGSRGGKTWTFSANANANDGGFIPTANGQVVVASVGVDNVFLNALGLSDPGLTAGNWMAVKYTDANNMLRVLRQSATNVRVERVVAGTPTTELDTTIVAATDPISSSALGIRINGTVCAVFINGRKIASFTLSAGAQALAGTSVAFQTTTAGRLNNDLMEIYQVS